MAKRTCERVPSSLVVKFNRGDAVCYGIVTNISEKGMCIKSGSCFPRDAEIELQIPLKDSQLNIPVKVKRIERTSNFYDSMGVELLKPTKKYLKIVNNLKIA
jgi:hypothetical protein